MLLKVQSASVLGIEARIIDIEVDLSLHRGRKYHVVGLPDVGDQREWRESTSRHPKLWLRVPPPGKYYRELGPG